jgi:hypothetical protein
LKKILSGGFKPFYSSEDLKMFDIPECPGIPMVSFCDIPLSQTRGHVGVYGRYAIGLDKKWAMRKNISPVHYIYEGSVCARVISEVHNSLPADAFNIECGCMKFNPLTAIFFFGKPYHGQMRREDSNTGLIEDKGEVIFYDEREWRYVPFADQTIISGGEVPADIRPMLSEKEYAKGDVRDKATASLPKHYRLTFGAADIKYLIVQNEDEIPGMVDFIHGELQRSGENTELRSCPQDEKKQLMARLLSMRQIEQGFLANLLTRKHWDQAVKSEW